MAERNARGGWERPVLTDDDARKVMRALFGGGEPEPPDKRRDAVSNAVNLLKRGGTALNLTYEEMSAMAGAADALTAAFPEYFEINRSGMERT